MEPKKYCDNLILSPRRFSKEVVIGDVPMGGNNPVRIQSMTNTNTNDIQATVAQSIRMIEAGSEYIRITAQGVKEAKNLSLIKEEIRKAGFRTPIIADIHFNPKAAEEAARRVEKIRINPGNYVDKYPKNKIDFTDQEYREELERIQERILPLLDICKEHGTAIRIGTNHGSLSQRIMSRFGDSPQGMAESAMEFIRMCHNYGFHQLVLSMKSSNIRVMVESTRLLVAMMHAENMDYPVHLGVTEAGNGFEGRVKSSAGIGALLKDGIGDTIRVSLTEDPEKELPVARDIVDLFSRDNEPMSSPSLESVCNVNPYSFAKRNSQTVESIIGGNIVPATIHIGQGEEVLERSEFIWEKEGLRWRNSSIFWHFADIKQNEYCKDRHTAHIWNIADYRMDVDKHRFNDKDVIVLLKDEEQDISYARILLDQLNKKEIKNPVLLWAKYPDMDYKELSLLASGDASVLFVDGLIEGLGIYAPNQKTEDLLSLNLTILQANGARFSKTEYVSCPSCGRTLFDIQGGLEEVKQRTAHLKGLKIAVMGCIVNGPGEMADADYGYIGAGPGKIALYKKKEQIENNIPENEAVDRLIDLIKQNGDWKEPV
ncbi:MAG: (E)-4-hydroxy-3-methylbut-2-enyl-diphosphate synthase [Bacteroidales bacterium]